MNAHDADPSLPDPSVPEAVVDGGPAADKPKRRRAPRKPAAVEAAGPDAPLVESAGQDAPLAEAAVAAALHDIKASRADLGVVADMAVGAAADVAATSPAQAGVEAGAGDDAGGDRPPGARRGRNRRRGRRGAERGEAVAGGDDDEAGVSGEAGEAGEAGEGAVEAADPPTPRPPPAEVGEVFAGVLSGAYDAEPVVEEAAQDPGKRVLLPEPDAPKLHKVLAQSGVGSRRDLEQMIVEKRITVNGEPAHTGQRISFGDRVAVDGKPVRFRIAPPAPRVLAYHKPVGEVVTHDDPQQRPTVFRRLPRLPQGKWQSVGRLDINTEGLLLFTNSGELANQLMHPRFGVEREYAVRSLGVLDAPAKARLLEGVEIDGQRAAFKSLEDGGGEGVNHWYRVVITEGRNREVRRLFEAVGHAVSRLIRIRYGSVVLPRGLKRGVWVDLDDHDLRSLRRLADVPRPERSERTERTERTERPEGAAPVDAEGGRGGRNRRGGRSGPEGTPPVQGDRPPRPERAPRGESNEFASIPNPLQQTFDRRAIQQDRSNRREISEDGPIPNPLQQTYDKRALQQDRAPRREISEDGPIPNPLQQTYDKRFAGGSRGPGFGPGGSSHGAAGSGGGAGGGQRNKGGGDPAASGGGGGGGYIGGDAFLRKGSGGRGGRSGGRGPGSSGGGFGGGGAGGGGGRGGGSGGGGGNRGGGKGGRGR